jgi:hypothetical protein
MWKNGQEICTAKWQGTENAYVYGRWMEQWVFSYVKDMLYVPTKINKSIVSYSVKFLLAATCLITKKKKKSAWALWCPRGVALTNRFRMLAAWKCVSRWPCWQFFQLVTCPISLPHHLASFLWHNSRFLLFKRFKIFLFATSLESESVSIVSSKVSLSFTLLSLIVFRSLSFTHWFSLNCIVYSGPLPGRTRDSR